MKKLILVMALFVTVFMNGLTAEAFPKGQQAVVGQTYFITGRNVWIRDEPNTNIAPVAAYRVWGTGQTSGSERELGPCKNGQRLGTVCTY